MIEIIYEDKTIVVCIKPPEVISEVVEGSLISLPNILISENGYKELFTVHRLDKDVSGLIVYAKTKNAAAALSKQITEGIFSKEYVAAVEGQVNHNDTLVDLLFFDRNKNKSYVVDRKRNGVREASLEYTVLKRENDRSYLSILLHTGRTHQIRVQFATRRHVLVGDRRYGAPKEDGNTLALLAHKLSFPHPTKKEIMSFQNESQETFFDKFN